MNEVIQHPPRTIMEVYKMLPEGTLAELIDNNIYMSPSPHTLHQQVSFKLAYEIESSLRKNGLGELFSAPLDVYLDEAANAVQPDVFVILKENASIVQPQGHIHGVPDLIIEILSPGNKNHDLLIKKNLYEKFGVKEYFIADPESNEVIHYLLEGGRFVLQPAQNRLINSQLLNATFQW